MYVFSFSASYALFFCALNVIVFYAFLNYCVRDNSCLLDCTINSLCLCHDPCTCTTLWSFIIMAISKNHLSLLYLLHSGSLCKNTSGCIFYYRWKCFNHFNQKTY